MKYLFLIGLLFLSACFDSDKSDVKTATKEPKEVAEKPKEVVDQPKVTEKPKEVVKKTNAGKKITVNMEELLTAKNCMTCHSVDGSRRIGPSLKGLFGKKQIVVSEGKEREIVVDEEYLKKAILDPYADIAKGYPPMMPPTPITAEELQHIINYIKEIK